MGFDQFQYVITKNILTRNSGFVLVLKKTDDNFTREYIQKLSCSVRFIFILSLIWFSGSNLYMNEKDILYM